MVTTRFYLDTRSTKNDGTYPMKLRLSVKGAAAFIALDVFLPSDQWDPIRQVVKKNCPNNRKLNEYLQLRKAQIDDYLRDLILDGTLAQKNAMQVRDVVMDHFYPKPKVGDFIECFTRFTASHENKRTREIYQATYIAMKKYCPSVDKLTFFDINKKWLDGFFSWLAENGSPSVNARNIHLRNIRAVFNDAIDNEMIDVYPFRKYKIRPVPTRKRSLTADQLLSIFNADVPKWQQKYIDAFKLIFLLIGINTIDMCRLQKMDLVGDRLSYVRAKTHRPYDIKVEPEAMEIIEKYKGYRQLLSFSERCLSYRSWTSKLNAGISSLFPGVTSYYARHSWATIASSLDIPKETIAAALGHGGMTVTDVYIDFDMKKVDIANRRVIDFVLYGKR